MGSFVHRQGLTRNYVWLLCMFLSACIPSSLTAPANLVPFSHALRLNYDLSIAEMKQLQFYVSSTITLNREVTSGDSSVTRGKLVTRFGQVIDEVVVEEKTPGIAVQADGESLTISFDPASNGTFGFGSPGGSVEYDGGYYYLYAVSWNSDGNGSLFYDGTEFEAINDSGAAHLMIDQDDIQEIVRNRKVLPGRTLGN